MEYTSPERDSNSQRLVVIGTDCIGSNNDEYTVYTDIFNIIPSYIRIPSGKNNKIYIYFSSTGDFKERSLGVPMFTIRFFRGVHVAHPFSVLCFFILFVFCPVTQAIVCPLLPVSPLYFLHCPFGFL
jgi:hypothetical protein